MEASTFVTGQLLVRLNEEVIHPLHGFSFATWKLEEIHASYPLLVQLLAFQPSKSSSVIHAFSNRAIQALYAA